MRIDLAIVAVVVGVAMGLPARAGQSPPDVPAEPTAGAEPDSETSSNSLPASGTPSLLLDRGTVPITLPTDAVPVEVIPPPAVPESVLLEKRCRLMREPDGGWFLLDFLDALPPGFPPVMRVLPGRELELLEAWAAEDDRVQFSVTGQTTAYHDEAYILPLSVAKIIRPLSNPTAQPEPVTTTKPAEAQAAASVTAESANTDQVRQSLTQDKPIRPAVPAPIARPADRGTDVAPPPGDILISRTIRIAPSTGGSWVEAHFEADNTLQEQPIPLLPCRLLERAETIDGKMRITGILRRYKGRDYLLLRKVLAERDMGQL